MTPHQMRTFGLIAAVVATLTAASRDITQTPTRSTDHHQRPSSKVKQEGPRIGARIPGIRYSLAADPDTEPDPGVAYLIPRVGATVEFAAGRGRLDVDVERTESIVRVDSTVIAPPAARSGDYYLFDSTGFVLVRPQSKTYSAFIFAVDEYNYHNGRDGWPQRFIGRIVRPDTLSAIAVRGPALRTIAIYWHMELYQAHVEHRPIHILAVGREIVDRIPAGDYSVVRWFGPTRALANLPGGVNELPGDSALRLTSVATLGPSTVGPEAFNLAGQHQIVGLLATSIDASRLAVPPGYREVPESDAGAASQTEGATALSSATDWTKPPEER
jgi:hypothetical protein